MKEVTAVRVETLSEGHKIPVNWECSDCGGPNVGSIDKASYIRDDKSVITALCIYCGATVRIYL